VLLTHAPSLGRMRRALALAALTATAVRELHDLGLVAAVIGTVEPGSGAHDDHGNALPWPARDEVARLLDEQGPTDRARRPMA